MDTIVNLDSSLGLYDPRIYYEYKMLQLLHV